MTRDKALSRTASILALYSHTHVRAAEDLPLLKANTEEALQLNEETARLLGIYDRYRAALANLGIHQE